MSENRMDRRTFLKVGSLGAAVTAAGVGMAETATPVCRTLGRTGLKINVIGLGTLKTDEVAVMQAAFDRGVNLIDTARVYQEGKNEALVCKAIKGRRDQIVLATKTKPGSKPAMDRWLGQSLTELQVDHVDMLYLHNIKTRDAVLNEEYKAFFAEAKKQGKARHIGVSAHSNMAEIVNTVVDDPDHLWEMVLVKHNYELKDDAAHMAAIARAAKAGVGVIAMKTQMKGAGDAIKELGDITPHQAALKWVLQDPNITAAIPGMLDLQQVIEDTAVMGMQLARADVERLERHHRMVAGHYCTGCAQCEGTCPHGVDIAEVNRSLMYAEDYGDMPLALSTYAELPANVCHDCVQCVARCAHGIDLAKRMTKARTLFA